MPVKLAVRFKASEPISPAMLSPKAIHGIFFSMFSEETGRHFHSPVTKPFSLFYPAFFKGSRETIISFTLEVNLLNLSLFPFLSRELLIKGKEKTLSVEGVKLELTSVKTISTLTFEDILEDSHMSQDFILDFLTPTSFKKGNYDFILPDPYLIFKNLIRRWNAFSPQKIDYKVLQYVKENVVVSGCWIRSQKTQISQSAKITGFCGRVFLYAVKSSDENKVLNSLLKFAEFSGVGRKTTMGFGKVRLVRKAEDAEEA